MLTCVSRGYIYVYIYIYIYIYTQYFYISKRRIVRNNAECMAIYTERVIRWQIERNT